MGNPPTAVDERVKKESPNMGTKTLQRQGRFVRFRQVKKESPNMGTKTIKYYGIIIYNFHPVKKESPNMGTKT